MLSRIRIFCAILIAITGVMLNTAHAFTGGPLSWGPPCSSIRFINTTSCTVQITLTTNPPGAVLSTLIPPLSSTGAAPTPSPMTIFGITSLAGNFYAVAVPGGAPPAPVPASASSWIPNVKLPPFPGCCCDIWFDTASCTCWIVPASFPPPCRP